MNLTLNIFSYSMYKNKVQIFWWHDSCEKWIFCYENPFFRKKRWKDPFLFKSRDPFSTHHEDCSSSLCLWEPIILCWVLFMFVFTVQEVNGTPLIFGVIFITRLKWCLNHNVIECLFCLNWLPNDKRIPKIQQKPQPFIMHLFICTKYSWKQTISIFFLFYIIIH